MILYLNQMRMKIRSVTVRGMKRKRKDSRQMKNTGAEIIGYKIDTEKVVFQKVYCILMNN
jgi:hypothetical protein